MRLLVLIVFAFTSLTFEGFAKDHKKSPLSTITVGQRTSDSTGTVSISSTQIEQAILQTIPFFTGYTVSGNATLKVSPDHSYLMFQVSKPNSSLLYIAVELKTAGTNNLTFTPHSYSNVFFYKVSGDCVENRFLTDTDKGISGCLCVKQLEVASTDANCKFSIIKCQ